MDEFGKSVTLLILSILSLSALYAFSDRIPNFALISNLFYPLFSGIAFLLFFRTYQGYKDWTGESSRAWLCFTVGIGCAFLGGLLLSLQTIIFSKAPGFSISDVIFMLGYAFGGYGIYTLYLMFFRGNRTAIHLLIPVIIILGICFTYFFIWPLASQETDSLVMAARIVPILLDFVLLSLLVPMALLLFGKPQAHVWIAVALGFIIMVAGDLFSALQIFKDSYAAGQISVFLLCSSYAFLALGAHLQNIKSTGFSRKLL